jgi:hypothetical protein
MRQICRGTSVLVVLLLLIWCAPSALGAPQHKGGGKSGSGTSASGSEKTVHVKEYRRKDGTVVKAHDRRPPGSANGAASTPSSASPPSTASATPAAERDDAPAASSPSSNAGSSSAPTYSAVYTPPPGTILTPAAPVFLVPDATRTPLRTLPQNARVRVIEDRGVWVQVEFHDSQYGTRVGYVEGKHLHAPATQVSGASGGAASLAIPSSAAQPVSTAEQSQTVYVTRTGSKYHRAGCRYLSKSAIATTLKEAAAAYSPCSVCKPPILPKR